MNRKTFTLLLALAAFCPWVNAAEAVFGTAQEIAGRHAGVVIAFPDVSHRPGTGQLPPGVPIPYPNLDRQSDTERGAAPHDRSHWQRAHGDAECDTPSPTIRPGGAYFQLPDVEVDFEGSQAVRHLDLMTHGRR